MRASRTDGMWCSRQGEPVPERMIYRGQRRRDAPDPEPKGNSRAGKDRAFVDHNSAGHGACRNARGRDRHTANGQSRSAVVLSRPQCGATLRFREVYDTCQAERRWYGETVRIGGRSYTCP